MEYNLFLPFQLNKNIHCILIHATPYPRGTVHWHATFCPLFGSEEVGNPKCLMPSVKHGGGNVMVWGWFGGGKVGDLYRVKGILKKEGYHSILQHIAIPCGRSLIGANCLLQKDNDTKHSSKLSNNYLGKKQSAGILSIMEWPAQITY